MLTIALALIAPVALAADPPAARRPVRYCIRLRQEVGAVLYRRECLTRERWLEMGIDPLAPRR